MKQGSSRLSSPGGPTRRRAVRAAGFTIVETLIVLAVTGFLFVAIAATLSGKQGRNQFIEAINNVQGQIQQSISEVQSGYYTNTNNFKCDSTGSGVHITPGAAAQGTNVSDIARGCVFLGKALQFGTDTTPAQVTAFSLAGWIGASGTDPVTALADSDITPIYKTTIGTYTNTTAPTSGVTSVGGLLNGLTLASFTYNNGGSDLPIAAVAFVSELGSLKASNTYNSGIQPVDLIPVGIGGSNLKRSNQDVANALNSINPTLINPKNGVKICFASGTTNQSGLITIGANGDSLRVDLQIMDGTTC